MRTSRAERVRYGEIAPRLGHQRRGPAVVAACHVGMAGKSGREVDARCLARTLVGPGSNDSRHLAAVVATAGGRAGPRCARTLQHLERAAAATSGPLVVALVRAIDWVSRRLALEYGGSRTQDSSTVALAAALADHNGIAVAASGSSVCLLLRKGTLWLLAPAPPRLAVRRTSERKVAAALGGPRVPLATGDLGASVRALYLDLRSGDCLLLCTPSAVRGATWSSVGALLDTRPPQTVAYLLAENASRRLGAPAAAVVLRVGQLRPMRAGPRSAARVRREGGARTTPMRNYMGSTRPFLEGGARPRPSAGLVTPKGRAVGSSRQGWVEVARIGVGLAIAGGLVAMMMRLILP